MYKSASLMIFLIYLFIIFSMIFLILKWKTDCKNPKENVESKGLFF